MIKTECKACNGTGQEKEFRTIVRKQKGKLVTLQLGSGCRTCRGLTVLEEKV